MVTIYTMVTMDGHDSKDSIIFFDLRIHYSEYTESNNSHNDNGPHTKEHLVLENPAW